MRYRETSPKQQYIAMYCYDLPQETRKISNKQSNPIPKRNRKTKTNNTQSEYKEGNNKDQSRNLKNQYKRSVKSRNDSLRR